VRQRPDQPTPARHDLRLAGGGYTLERHVEHAPRMVSDLVRRRRRAVEVRGRSAAGPRTGGDGRHRWDSSGIDDGEEVDGAVHALQDAAAEGFIASSPGDHLHHHRLRDGNGGVERDELVGYGWAATGASPPVRALKERGLPGVGEADEAEAFHAER
jgi:hypothetical protein